LGRVLPLPQAQAELQAAIKHEENSDSRVQALMAEDESGGGRALGTLKVVAIIVPVVVALVGLAFTVRPSLRPCIGESNAAFTGAPVFPRVSYAKYLRRQDLPPEPGAQSIIGAEVRFSLRVDGFRGEELRVYYTLVRVEPDGTTGPVDPTQDRAVELVVTPDSCSSIDGKDIFVLIPKRGVRYRAVLELYRGSTLNRRLALAQTAVFRG
jgi:hypothetical protein